MGRWLGAVLELRGPAAIVAAVVVLAGLDFAGAVLAKEWVERREVWLFLAGLAMFGLLFVVYALSLRVADLSVVTFGWIVLLQVGLLAVERFHYGVELGGRKWFAVAVILVLQTYLLLAPSPGAERPG